MMNELKIFQFNSKLAAFIIVGKKVIFGVFFSQFTSETEKKLCIEFLLNLEGITEHHIDLSYNNERLKKELK